MEAVLFDLDGTLVDSSIGITRSVQYALKHYGIEEQDKGKLRLFIGPPLVDSFQKYYGFSEEQAKEAVLKYRERYTTKGILECRLYPGVENCIRILKGQGYLVCLASSKPETFCKRILGNCGILELFDEVVGATLDGSRNSKEQVLDEVFKRWSRIQKESVCLVGDTVYDARGAKNAGISFVAVTFGFGDLEEIKEAGVDAVCQHMDELPKILEKLI